MLKNHCFGIFFSFLKRKNILTAREGKRLPNTLATKDGNG
jgi:hypothetical protein